MFSWICPKCGHEVPPAYSECPNCAPIAKEEPAAGEKAPAAPVAAAPPPPLPARPAAPPSLVVPAAAAPPEPTRNRIAIPGWLASIGFALIFLVFGLTALVVKQARQSAPPPAPNKAAQIETALAVPATQSNPEFKDLELIGFRLTEDDQQKPYVQFTVVNHSGADLGEVGAKAELKAITARDKLTVGSFEFKTKLNAYQAQDLKVPLETKLRVYELPDWQFLRADITGH